MEMCIQVIFRLVIELTRYINVAKDIILIITDTVDSQICFSLKQGRGKNQFGWLYFSVNENEYIA